MEKNILLKPRFEGWSVHSLYNEIIENPPKGYTIEFKKPNIQSKIYNIDNKSTNPLLKEIIYHLKPIPYIVSQKLQKKYYSNYDLIYASQHIVFNNDSPWISDFEFVNAYAGFGNINLIQNTIRKQFESKNCKFILPWSEWAKKTLFTSMDCSKFEEKIKILRYTVNPKKIERKKHESVNFLFIGSTNPMNIKNIHYKGVNEIISAFNQISKKYDNISLTIRAKLPENIKKNTSKNNKINVIDSFLNKNELYQLYQNADVFVFPAHETSGIALLDAMSFELPVIAMNLYDIPEVVSHMENGLLIQPHKDSHYYTKNYTPNDHSWKFMNGIRKHFKFTVDQIKEYFIKMIEEPELRKKLGYEARKKIENELSIDKRNALLKEIFEEATR